MKLDPIDLRILAEVQRDGRITKVALAERVGLSATPCWNRLRRLEDAGIISGYHAHVAARAVVSITLIFVEIKLAGHRKPDFDRFERAVRQVPQIISCWATGGSIDYLLRVVARDIAAYQEIMDRLLAEEVGISRYFTFVVTKTVKDDPVLPIAEALRPPAVAR
ncbi:MAG: Lrp/AsnC family transcriptional regulator [Rhizobiales bacterium]|nr:Lrp/AsnC family transcriptional regulator [Hyphomicrobiales bacterium]MBN9011393.1 Lrp/AsnC family transcriptional regulator [Hyphomicrobiales bacterium]